MFEPHSPGSALAFALDHHRPQQTLVLRICGDADFAHESELRVVLAAALVEAPKVLIVELSRAFVDVRGLTALLVLDQQARRRGVTVILAGASATLRRIVGLFRLPGRLPCFGGVAEALAAGQPPERSNPSTAGGPQAA